MLFNDEVSFSTDNYSNGEIELGALPGDYKVVVYSSKHEAGFAVEEDSNSENNFTKFEWDYDSALDFTVLEGNNTLIISFPSNDNLGYISGNVILDNNSDIESGWIEIYNSEIRRGAVVEENGSFVIEGLTPTADENYTIEYSSWEFDGLTITKNVGTWTEGNLTDFNITRSTMSLTASGQIDYNGSEELTIRALLIKKNQNTGDWKVIQKADLNGSNEYIFTDLEQITGIEYFVAAGVKVKDETGTHYIKYNATSLSDNTVSGIDDNDSFDVTFSLEAVYH